MSEEIIIRVARGKEITGKSFISTIIFAMANGITLPQDICKYAGWSYHTVRTFLFNNDLPPMNHYVKLSRVQVIQQLAHDRKMQLKDLAVMVGVPPSYASWLLRRATGLSYQQTINERELKKYDPDPFAGACWSVNRRDARF